MSRILSTVSLALVVLATSFSATLPAPARLLPASLSVLLLTSVAHALPTIEAVGNKFFDSNGNQFFIKGVAYQLVPHDPLIDQEQCGRDVALMQKLGANAIRVYHVDASANHDGCMKQFADAGIYALIDLDTFDTYILPDNLYWNQTQLDHYTAVMDAFHAYDNLLGFFVGNEVIAAKAQSNAAPFVRAAARDVKAYRDRKGYRHFPVGYSAADIAELRPQLQDYLTCGGNTSETIDMFGLNSYSWCDPSTYETSDYAQLQNMSHAFPVPVFFSETGCNVPGPRLFADQAAVFGPQMAGDWSGSIIYEWIEEVNNYGLVSYGPPAPGAKAKVKVRAAQPAPDPTDPPVAPVSATVFDGYTRGGEPQPRLPDFSNLQSAWAAASPTGVKRSAYDAAASVTTRDCPSSTPGGWLVNGNVRLPSVGETFQGTYTTSHSAADPKPSKSKAAAAPALPTGDIAGKRAVAGMGAGLAGVMLLFGVWM